MAKKVVKEKSPYHCRDCEHSYDWHEKDWKGDLFMCRCKFSQWNKFLNRDVCNKFELKKKDNG